MRLIDADVLLEDLKNRADWFKKGEYIPISAEEFTEIVDESETVDAIPVEWIEKEYCKMMCGLPMSVSQMLKIWGEENEID